jgi:cell division ATPase FtsA
MKKQDVLNRVLNSESSIFAKDDVVRLIEMIEGEGKTITVTDIGAAIENAMDNLSRNSYDIVDKSTAEFDLNGNEISLVEVDLDLDYIRETLEEHLMPLLENITLVTG